VFPILLPPLRDRLDDIPELAAHFAERAAVRFGLTPVAPTVEHIELLRGYAWPGNIRELGAVIDRAAILGEGRTLEILAALGFGTDMPARAMSVSHAGLGARPPAMADLRQSPGGREGIASLDEAMKRHIELALEKCRGRVEGPKGVAAALKINPHTLRARMRKLGVEWGKYREE
jgi:transcriptional regulator with GAF, ATPase, and Fis domain